MSKEIKEEMKIEIQQAIRAVELEPGFTDDIPSDMKNTLEEAIDKKDVELIVELMKISVRLTKEGIIERLNELKNNWNIPMKKTRLIQRLHKPAKKINNPFSFGVGLKNGGLSDDAMELINGVFSFDYMGASEFEHGAVPLALQEMKECSLSAGLIASIMKTKKGEEVFLIIPSKHEKKIIQRINLIRNGTQRHGEFLLKEHCGLREYFDSDQEWNKKNVGWLELDNAFMFFVDKEMWQKTCELFELKAE